MLLSGADILVRTLIDLNCKVVFGYPGGQILNVYDSLYKYKDEIRHILTCHEQGAAHAADGYSRVTGEVGVVMATSGPGATNLVTGIATAHLDSVPMLAITGNVASSQIGNDNFQEIDITGITLPITKHNYFVDHVSELQDTVIEAFSLALSGRQGPVLIDVPRDVQSAMWEYSPKCEIPLEKPLPAKDERIREAAECINKSKKPYIYFGGGMATSDAVSEMLSLAEKIDAPLGSSLMGISTLSSDNERFLGMQGMHGNQASSLAMQAADCIIALGVRFSERSQGDKSKFAKDAKIVHIDIDGAELSKIVPTDHTLRGDLKESLKKLLPLIEERKNPLWQKEIAAFKEKEEESKDKREGMTPKNILKLLSGYLKENTPVATDVGQHQMWTAQYLPFRKEKRFLSSGGLGTMGFGMGAAMGAAVALKERAVLITGDGSFSMNLNELATMVTEKIPAVILIMNNGVLGMVRQWQTCLYDKRYSHTETKRETDFVALAKAFGADGMMADNLSELKDAFDKAFQKEGPFVIDCIIDKEELVLPMKSQGDSDIILGKEK